MNEYSKKQANQFVASRIILLLSKFLKRQRACLLRQFLLLGIVSVIFLSITIVSIAESKEVLGAVIQLKDKPSLKHFAEPLFTESEITPLYREFYKSIYLQENAEAIKDAKLPSNEAAKSTVVSSDADLQKKHTQQYNQLSGKYSAQLQKLESYFQQQQPFVRGEIEDEKVLGATLKWLQLAMIDCRVSAQKNQWVPVRQHMSAWFAFAADLAYEESSLIGIRVSAVMRALLMDELEKLQAKHSAQIAQSPDVRLWFLQVRAPWPIDRVLVSEAKMRLKPAELPLAESLAQRLQKNPYQSVDKILSEPKMRHSAQTAAADFLRKLWRDEDIQQMKMEMNRIGILKIRLAMAEYQVRLQKAAANVTELVQNRFLDQVPTDYFSGKPMDLTSAQKK